MDPLQAPISYLSIFEIYDMFLCFETTPTPLEIRLGPNFRHLIPCRLILIMDGRAVYLNFCATFRTQPLIFFQRGTDRPFGRLEPGRLKSSLDKIEELSNFSRRPRWRSGYFTLLQNGCEILL